MTRAIALPPEIDAAMTWAGALALELNTLTRDELRERWDGDAGRANRAVLKVSMPGLLQVAVDHVRARVAELNTAEAA